MMPLRSLSRFAISLTTLGWGAGLTLALAGCGIGDTANSLPDIPVQASGPKFQGSVHGGQQPVVDATIQLYAAGTPASGGGYGTGAVALIPTGSYAPGGALGCTEACTALPQTDSTGSFLITGDYTCPSADSEIYIVAKGGTPSVGSGANNYITMMAALGACTSTNSSGQPTLNPSSFININEVTTVASVYALQQFMSAPVANTIENIGAPGTTYKGVQTGVVGLQNAFSMANAIVNNSTGMAQPISTGIVVETGQLYTIADILAACVNTDPAQSSVCSTLMTDATPSGATTATDTLQAAYYIAQNPYNNVSALYGLKTSTPPFPPSSAAPIDLTLAVQFEPSYLNGTQATPAVASPISLAIDAYGNVWVVNAGITANNTYELFTTPSSVAEVSPTGKLLMGPVSSYTASHTGGVYSQFTTPPTNDVRTFSNVNSTGMVAIDLANNAWVSNHGDSTVTNGGTSTATAAGSVATFTGSTGPGSPAPGSVTGYYVGLDPDGIAIDGNNNVFLAHAFTSGLAAGSLGEFIAGSSNFAYSTSATGTNVFPYKLNSNESKIAIGQNKSVTNTLGGTTRTNDGSLLWVSQITDCSAGGFALGAVDQFTTTDLLPTANANLASSGGSVACPTADKVGATFAALTANPTFIAVDRNDNVWLPDEETSVGFDGVTFLVTNPSTGAVDPTYGSVTYTAGTPASTTYGGAGFGIRQPYAIAIDGNNHAWFGNQSVNAISEFSSTLGTATTPPTISLLSVPQGSSQNKHQFNSPQYIAIDPSGNIWITDKAGNQGAMPIPGTDEANSLTVLVGLAAPVVTPLSVATATGTLGTKP